MSSDGIVVVDLDNTIVDVNDAFVGMLGYGSKDNLLGTNGLDLISPEHHDKILADMKEAIKKGRAENLEYNFITKDGDELVLEMGVSPMRDQNGRASGLVTICRNVTDRKRRELELRRSLMRFDMSEGNVYLVEEETSSKSLGAFRDLMKVGYTGYVLSRSPWEKNFRDLIPRFQHRWMTENRGDGTLPPNPVKIGSWVKELPKKHAILLDRLDYLISKNGTTGTIGLVHSLGETAHLRDHIIIMSLDPDTLDDRELAIIEKETRDLVPIFRAKLPKELDTLLRLIFDRNLSGGEPSHTDISDELKLSKPTVRKRLKELLFSGHITEATKGNRKVLAVTEKGRGVFVK
jgi:PAS domain S-box-containing protein